MCVTNSAKSRLCELVSNSPVNADIFILQFNWSGPPPRAGQFFMLKPERSSVFLPRPISIFEYNPAAKLVKFLIAKAGRGTEELARLQGGDKARLTGPLGNAWADFLPESVSHSGGKAALVGGSLGLAPLAALVAENPKYHFDFFAGFKNGFREKDEENAILGAAARAKKIVIAAEDGRNAFNGRIVEFIFDLESHDVLFACGSSAMLQAVKKKCESRNIACFLSLESRMACGTGACLGCSVRTVNGNRRCCADGPIFPANEVIFDEVILDE